MDLSDYYWWNDNIAICCSVFMNSIVVYFVLLEQTKALRSYSKMILLNCFIELFLAAVSLLLRPRIMLGTNTFILIITSSWWQSVNDQLTLNLLISLLALAGATDCIKIMVEFVYRYLVVCRQYQMSLGQLILVGGGIYLYSFVYTCLLFLTFSQNPLVEWRDVVEKSEFWSVDGKNGKFVVSETHSFVGLAMSVLGLLTAISTYSVIILCSQRILLTLRNQRTFMSLKTSKMHQGLNRMLFAQACAPLATSVIPAFVVLGSILFGHGSDLMGHAVSFTLPWTTVPGPLCTLIFVPSYRRRITSCFLGGFKKNFKVSVTHVSTTARH